jgi:hypothetical protein
MKPIAPALLSVLVLFASSAFGDTTLVKFKGGIGVIPVSSGVVTPATAATALTADAVNRNFVRGVPPPGQPWVIRDLDATVKTDGSIRVKGRGLLLAGATPGTNAGASVFASLLCEAASPFGEHHTNEDGVPLAANGDFEIDGGLSPLPPTPCNNPVLLIRNTSTAANQGWFAAGIPDLD